MVKVLPPLPPSDQKSLSSNREDSFYQLKPSEFWGTNKIYRIDDTDKPKCKHYFERSPEGAKCKLCLFGLIGFFGEINNGKLIINGSQVNF